MTLEPGGPRPEPSAGLVTRGFLFADLRGYTAFVEANGDAAGAALLDDYRRLVRETITHHGGAEIRTEGDSFYVVFPSASSAVAGGLGIAAAAEVHNANDPERPIHVGVGVHAGEAVEGPEGYVGSAVNIAARVCAQAGSGEVLVSETVRSLIRTSGRLSFSPKGRRQLKGIAEPIALFRVEAAGAAPIQVVGRGPGERRLALLLGGGALVGLVVLAAVALRGAPGATSSPSPTEPVAAATATPEIVERIAYTAVPQVGRDSVPECQTYLEGRLVVRTPTGSPPLPVMAPSDLWETHPAWSPDGTRIAFIGYDQQDQASLYVVAADGSGLRNLLAAPAADLIDPGTPIGWRRPSWSADGTRLLFTYGNSGVWTVGADGTGLKLLVQPLNTPPEPTPDPQGNVEPVFAPEFGQSSWLSDGRIAVEVTTPTKDPKTGQPATVLEVASAEGVGLKPITGLPLDLDITEPAWSSDGRLAFIGAPPSGSLDTPPARDLYVLDVGASAARKLPIDAGAAAYPAWSPDGTRLIFGALKLFTIGADGSGLAELPTVAGQAACWPSWGRTSADRLPAAAATVAPGATPATSTYHRGTLTPGTYGNDVFAPHVRFTVDGGWYGLNDYVDAFGLARPDVPSGEIDVGRVQVISKTPCVTSPTELIGPKARDFIAWLQGHPFLTTSDPTPVIVGGKSGLAVDVTASRGLLAKDCPDMPFAPDNPMWKRLFLFRVGETTVWLRLHDQVRIVSIDVNDGPAVTFILESTPDYYSHFIPYAQAVVDSLEFP